MEHKIKTITSLSDIQFNIDYNCKIAFLKLINEGERETKKPLVAMCQFIDSGIMFKISTWDYGLLGSIKTAIDAKSICNVIIYCSQYKDSVSVRLKSLEITTDKLKEEVNEEVAAPQCNNDVSALINGLVGEVHDEVYSKLLSYLLNDERFYTWPAAKSIHHAFKGGLALHSLNVCNNALNISNMYSLKLNYDLIITGALIHDIGKCDEYTSDGNFSQLGQMLSHIVLGIEKIDSACDTLGIDKNDLRIIKLKHVIASHHGKLEFGSPNTPVLPEAYIVSLADNVDAKTEVLTENLPFVNDGCISESFRGLDNGKILKI